MTYSIKQKVLFKHCDPAGIVFYPRYFEMINDTVESFFSEILACPFEELHKTGGVPAAQINTQFWAPSRHGDMLTINLDVTRIGNSSLSIDVNIICDTEKRLTSSLILVNIDLNGKSTPFAESVKEKARAHLIESTS